MKRWLCCIRFDYNYVVVAEHYKPEATCTCWCEMNSLHNFRILLNFIKNWLIKINLLKWDGVIFSLQSFWWCFPWKEDLFQGNWWIYCIKEATIDYSQRICFLSKLSRKRRNRKSNLPFCYCQGIIQFLWPIPSIVTTLPKTCVLNDANG